MSANTMWPASAALWDTSAGFLAYQSVKLGRPGICSPKSLSYALSLLHSHLVCSCVCASFTFQPGRSSMWEGLFCCPKNGVVFSSAALPPLTLTEAVACPPEPACIWPVRFVYGTAEHGSRLLSFLERPHGASNSPEGEQMEIAGLHATVAISKEPLPARADLSVWQATVWLPVSVIRVVATTITEDPEGNPFNSELGLTATLSLLMELR